MWSAHRVTQALSWCDSSIPTPNSNWRSQPRPATRGKMSRRYIRGWSHSAALLSKARLPRSSTDSILSSLRCRTGSQLSGVARIVDLGADHRLRDATDWDVYYGGGPAAEPWIYGLPELPGRRDQVAEATRVANPGCYATALQLSAAPLLDANLVDAADIVAVAASGTSGAGRKASISLSATEVMGSMSAYKVGGLHQHTPEVVQELSAISDRPVTMSFTPTLAPMPRGILATTTMQIAEGVTANHVADCVRSYYEHSTFVYVLPQDMWPTTSATSATNCAHMQVAVDERAGRVVVVAAIDNLGKGAAGQAIQNANRMSGFEESLGLSVLGVQP